MWEETIFSWGALGHVGRPIVPEAVMALLSAQTEAQASLAFQRLDGDVCLAGQSSTAALPVIQLLLSQLPRWSEAAAPYCLELLGLICAAESPSDSPEVQRKALEYLRQAAWYFFHGLQFGPDDTVPLHVDLVTLLGSEFDDVRVNAESYLRRTLERPLSPAAVKLVENSLEDLYAS